MSRRGNTGMHSGNDAPGDLAGRPTAAPDPYEPGPYAYTCDPADPVLAERYARRRRAAVAGLLAAVVLGGTGYAQARSEEHTSELQSRSDLVCRLLLEKKKK